MRRFRARQRVVRDRVRGPDDKGVGPGEVRCRRRGRPPTHADGTHQRDQRVSHLVSHHLHVLGGRGQKGHVLGPGNEQGRATLPRPPLRVLRAGAAPHARPPRDGRPRLVRQSLGRSHREAVHDARRPHQHGRRARLQRGRPPGHHGLVRLDRAALGPRRGQVVLHADPSQEGHPRSRRRALRVLVLHRRRRQPEKVAVQGRQVPPEPRRRPRRDRQRPRAQRRRRPRLRRRRRLPPLLGLPDRLQLPAPRGQGPAGLPRVRGRHLRRQVRPLRLAPRHRTGRQDHQDLEGGPLGHARHRPDRHGRLDEAVSPASPHRSGLRSPPWFFFFFFSRLSVVVVFSRDSPPPRERYS
mmetsp:Transcript_6553/g.19934  ORF Transcript_6553/g.19934 Transcript_6553/m.19934 type:complete len:353 (+) Transcript_6553:520-1578(+)